MARQKLGQHFLIRASILERIAAAVCPEPEPVVIEIGPGKGALTEHLLRRCGRLIAIEIDPELVACLRSRFPGEPRLEIVAADVLETDLAAWGSAALAGNLPYYITTPILEKAVSAGERMKRAVFLMQKEVAERVTAAPGNRQYGYISAALRLFSDAAILFEVKPGAFQPPPKVDSAVVRLTPHARVPELGIADPARFLEFISRCFRQKRKTLRNNLAAFYPRALLDTLPDTSRRAEELTLEAFAALYRILVG